MNTIASFHNICRKLYIVAGKKQSQEALWACVNASQPKRNCAAKINNNEPTADTSNSAYSPTVTDFHPLKGIRILDLTRIIAGPYCTMVLADMGAEVLKIERPYFGGDEARKWGPPFLKVSKDATYFLAQNRNKKSVCLDLKKGKDVIYELAQVCDVLVENYVPGKLNEYGLGYEQLHAIAPHLIYCSLTGYGSVGPYAQRPGYDVIAASMGGLLHITGERNGPPSKVGVAVTDIATGLYAHGAILAALLQRQRTGRGQKIDVNLFSTQVSLLINVASNYLNADLEAQRWGTAHSSIVPYQSFKTADGYLTLGAGSDAQFKELCSMLDINEIADHEKFKTNKDRVKNREELVTLLTNLLSKNTSKHWMQCFEGASFPVGPVNSIREVFEDEHIKGIDLVKTLPHAKDGQVRVVGPPVVFSEAKNDARTAPPVLGEHTDEVLKTILGYNEEKMEALRFKKIIQ
ncbi:succinate--hydroxymethylglutarate CoA-transferase-like [Teleopsis dalmanni]|uniref:succinate--hydroxymethylglutarate CoA-transferase-like n=1 Tax=Teleopsis dalmanni TaxID=139649 RepID=UPI0018CD8C03|nr:succinate--hydroxymethylglutarate CoA-transferase-like [Teleopsis dalmanni]